jgi:hypothetical protein
MTLDVVSLCRVALVALPLCTRVVRRRRRAATRAALSLFLCGATAAIDPYTKNPFNLRTRIDPSSAHSTTRSH